MLDSLRKSSRSWVAKALLLLLLASFAFWGISGQVLNGGAGNAVVTAGETKVSIIDYRLAYDRQMAVYSRQLGERITSEQARLFGIDRQVLGQMVAGAVLDEQSRTMNLGLSKDRLATLVASDPAFTGVNGQFSRENFRQVLRNIGMSEDDYIRNRQEVAIRQQVVEAVSDGIKVPNVLLEAIAQYDGETRDVEYLTIAPGSIDPVTAPDDGTLRTYFDANSDAYRAPEYRKINYVRLTPDEIIDEASVTEDEIRADYDARKDRFSKPETRVIQQIVYSDNAAASAAHQRILAGQSFEDAVADAGKTLTDVDLGTLEKAALPDQTVADAAFALANPGDVSNVIDGAFGPVVVRVTEINKEAVQPFEAVRDQIRRELALVTANDTLLDIHDAYEDGRAAGETMQEAATRQKLTMSTIDSVDAEGLSPSGETVTSIAEQQPLIEAAFEAENGAENPPINAGQNGFVWYEVADIVPSRDRTLEEVKDRVTADWIYEETDKRLEARAREVAESLQGDTTLASVAESEGFTTQFKYGLQRAGDDADFGKKGITEVFDGGPTHAGYFAAPTGNAYQVFKITSTSQTLGGIDAISESTRTNIESSMADDLLDQMVAKLQTVFPVQVNQSAIERALSVQ
jgi:peptidyl-prolyl cis-trans isomerase D